MAKCKFMVFGFLLHAACGSDHQASKIAATGTSSDIKPTNTALLEYYSNDIMTLEGEELVQSLYEEIRNHKKISYKSADVALVDIDRSLTGSGETELFYSGILVNKKQRSVWNKEHLWPQSRGLDKAGSDAKSDLHHLRPTIKEINSVRGNKDFDLGGRPVKEAPNNFVDNNSFEPRDEVKGDTARSIFYMAVRYKNALKMKKDISGTGFYMGNLCKLLEWHEQDQVSAHESSRHERVYSHWQKNRNPFIDYPQLARKVWGKDCQ